LLKNENFGLTYKVFSENKNLGKNGNFGQKWKFWAKMEILV